MDKSLATVIFGIDWTDITSVLSMDKWSDYESCNGVYVF